MKILIIDIQGFKIGNNKFSLKELAAYDGKLISHFVFRRPFPFHHLNEDLQKQANWLMKNHHCIDWNEGFIPQHEVKNIIHRLTSDTDVIYVKGREKKDILETLTKTAVIEFDEQPALNPTQVNCFFHSKMHCMCALSNVYDLYNNHIINID